ncbi:MAG: TonB-dependent receptor [Muribaculaceae bacterium]|nr:TonB-dependent receptor [Muribaculaceae bacterium]
MKTKIFLSLLTSILYYGMGHAQNSETADTLTQQLQEVVVTAKQPATKLVGTTLVSTIPGSNLADIGNALDVLNQLPMIRVQDNEVTVIGKSNIEIYIDGRSMRDEQELQQLLSSNIKKVELLMAPGAMYESTTGAVLKITTKRNFVQGLSVTDQFILERRRKWSVMDFLSLSYNAGHWEFFADGTINHNNTLIKGSTTNTLVYQGKETIVGGSQNNDYLATVGSVKAGFNYAKDNQSLGAYYRYNPERGNFKNTGSEWYNDEPEIQDEIKKQIRAHSHLVSAYYENMFADKYLLHFDGDFKSSFQNNSVATTYPDASHPVVNSTDKRNSTLVAGKLYLNFPLWNGEFTVGTQDSYTHTSLDYQMLNPEVEEYIPSSLTDAKQTSVALYAAWSRMFGKFSLNAGLRYEYVNYEFKVNNERDDDVSRRHNLLTPDISLGYSFNDESQISLSYKMATVKPPYSQLTGSLSYVGIHQIEGGNPMLRDERMHEVQLFGTWKGFMLQADFTRSMDAFASVKQLYPADNLQVLLHPININLSSFSLYLVWSKPVKRWTPDVTVGLNRQWLELDGTKYNKPMFSYFFNNTLSLPHGWLITANISGYTSGDMRTTRFGKSLFTMDMSVGKTFFNKSLNVKLSATDIFNTANNDWTMNTFGIFVDKKQSNDNRGIALNIIYKFQPYKSKYKGSSASETELKRL